MRDSPTGITERELEKRWDIVTSRFISVLQGDLKKMATVDGDVNEALLAELGWALSKKQFEGLVEGKTSASKETANLFTPSRVLSTPRRQYIDII